MFSLWPNARSQFSVHFVFSMQIVVLDLHICIQKIKFFSFFFKLPKSKRNVDAQFPIKFYIRKVKVVDNYSYFFSFWKERCVSTVASEKWFIPSLIFSLAVFFSFYLRAREVPIFSKHSRPNIYWLLAVLFIKSTDSSGGCWQNMWVTYGAHWDSFSR